MIGFREYLTEAKVSPKNFEKAVDIFKRLLEKKVGHRFYRFGGAKGFVEIKNGMGIMYIYNKNKAIRFNYIKNEIRSITLWDAYKLGADGNKTVDLGGLGLLQAAYKLVDILAAPNVKLGSIRMYPMVDVTEEALLSGELLTEAKRVTPEEFASGMIDNLPPGARPNAVTWEQMRDYAVDHDVTVPGTMRDNKDIKSGKGKNATFDLTKALTLTGKDAGNSKPEPDYFIKITAQDRETKRFQSVQGDKRAQEMLGKIRDTLANPPVQEEMKDPNKLFGIMKNLVQVVARGARNSLIIYGGPGTGKTFVVNQTLKEEGMNKGSDYYVIKGKITTTALYRNLFMHRKGGLLVFDDTDSVWGDAEAANILKAALDSYDERTISWYSNRNVNVSKMSKEEREEYNDSLDTKIKDDPTGNHKLPSEFDYEGRIIFISNLPYEKFDSAVLTRSAKIDMTLTDAQMFMRIEGILEHIGKPSVDMDAKRYILNFLKEQNAKGILQSPSMRTFVAAEDLYLSGVDNWKELLDYI